ncbi:MAG: hypothetical protein JKX85_03450, partial [Phycisphaeraceae bacterium]|nr:hypothetical protein [Phycisphaeraceae bacterium]
MSMLICLNQPTLSSSGLLLTTTGNVILTAGPNCSNTMGAHVPMQTHLGLILAFARALVSCLKNLAIAKVLSILLLLTGLSFVCISQASAQVKEVTTLLELARESTIELQALPLADQRSNMLLTQGLEQLEQAQKLANHHMDQLGAAQGPLSGADRNLTRLQLARITYIRGELYRLAATKYTPTDPVRQAYLDSAVMIFTDMRKTFNSINDAQLARVGLARCYRLLGQLDQAIEILAPLLRLPNSAQQPVNENQLNLWRAAVVEELEIMLLQSPKAAITQVHTWMTHRAFVQKANWIRSLKRIDALAAVQLALINPTVSPVTLAVKRLADSPLPTAVQLQYLVQLELASNLPIISPQQRNDWVLLIVDTLHAQQAVDRISRQIPDPAVLNTQAVMAYGSALWQVGKLGLAVNSFDRAMQLTDTSDPMHATASYWHAQ